MTHATCNEPDCDNPTRISTYGRHTRRCHVHGYDKATGIVGKRCRWCGKDYHTDDSSGRKGNQGCCTIECGSYWHGLWPTSHPINWTQCVACMRWYTSRRYEWDTCSIECKQQVADLLRPEEYPKSRVWSGDCTWCGRFYYGQKPTTRRCSRRCGLRAGRARRNAREHGASGSYTWTQVMRLFLLGNRRCAYCDEVVDGQPDPDHVIPLSRGGSNSIGNIVPACRSCNVDKNDHGLDEWATERERRQLPPRRTRFEHADVRFAHLLLNDIASRKYWRTNDAEINVAA